MAQALGIYKNVVGKNPVTEVPPTSPSKLTRNTRQSDSSALSGNDSSLTSKSADEDHLGEPVFSLQSHKKDDWVSMEVSFLFLSFVEYLGLRASDSWVDNLAMIRVLILSFGIELWLTCIILVITIFWEWRLSPRVRLSWKVERWLKQNSEQKLKSYGLRIVVKGIILRDSPSKFPKGLLFWITSKDVLFKRHFFIMFLLLSCGYKNLYLISTSLNCSFLVYKISGTCSLFPHSTSSVNNNFASVDC